MWNNRRQSVTDRQTRIKCDWQHTDRQGLLYIDFVFTWHIPQWSTFKDNSFLPLQLSDRYKCSLTKGNWDFVLQQLEHLGHLFPQFVFLIYLLYRFWSAPSLCIYYFKQLWYKGISLMLISWNQYTLKSLFLAHRDPCTKFCETVCRAEP